MADENTVTNDPTETDTVKADTPPRRARRTTSARTRTRAQAQDESPPEPSIPDPPKPSSGGRTLQKRLEELFGSLALPYAAAGDEYGAALIAQRAPALAEAWAELAKQNAGVRRVLERLVQGTAWGAVVLSSASVMVPLLAHHGVIPIPVDPFAGMYGADPMIPVRGRTASMPAWDRPEPPNVIITEPPTDGDMTPPVGPDSPPGTFTVAGSSNGATIVPEAM